MGSAQKDIENVLIHRFGRQIIDDPQAYAQSKIELTGRALIKTSVSQL